MGMTSTLDAPAGKAGQLWVQHDGSDQRYVVGAGGGVRSTADDLKGHSHIGYRNLGVEKLTGGRIGANISRTLKDWVGGQNGDPRQGIHTHAPEFRFNLTLSGKMRVWYEGYGDVDLEAGSLLSEPADLNHEMLACTGDRVSLSFGSPAKYATAYYEGPVDNRKIREVAAKPDKVWVQHLRDAVFEPGAGPGHRAHLAYRDLKTAEVSEGRFAVYIERALRAWSGEEKPQDYAAEFQMLYGLAGEARYWFEENGEVTVHAGTCVAQIAHLSHRMLSCTADYEVVEVISPATF